MPDLVVPASPEPIAMPEPSPSSSSPAPSQIGPYRILRRLGEGGMGEVYVAEQSEPVKRQVALKLIKLGMDSREIVARFEQERQALALMQHDGIAKVFDVGTSERGQPYFVMELIAGVPLDEYCDAHKLDLAQRLALVQQVCAAVTHAHQKGVVHRDLKPGNVLVADDGGAPRPKVIDFGLAKALGPKLTKATLHTEAGRVLGTPEYMAPEQIDPTNADIDTRVDVYALGVMLYQLLVGALPFPTDRLRNASMEVVQRILREEEPMRPSARLSRPGRATTEVSASRRTSTAALQRALRSDLDWVVLKAMEKDRSRRYDSPAALAADLQRYLDHEPLQAGPPSAWYRVRKLVRRYRGQFAAAGLVVGASVAFGGVAAVQYVEKGRTIDRFNQLAAVVRLADARAQQQRLWPAGPDMVEALQAWLAGPCQQLLDQRPQIEATIAELRRAVGPEPAAPGAAADRESARFLLDALKGVVAGLDSLATTDKADVEQRLAWARQVAAASAAHPQARATWREARAAIAKADGVVASASYAGRSIAIPDGGWVGLVPIGMNPVTKLWEFYDLRSAWDGKAAATDIAIPTHQPDGRIEVGEGTGIVFVLLPGGTVTLGSQDEDPAAPFYDPQREDDETLHEVTLSPFLFARHELTQGQWARLWTWDAEMRVPSQFKVGFFVVDQTIGAGNPVEQVSWSMCDRLLSRHGLAFPTEAQWEYGCRGGSRAPWIKDREALRDVANLADADAKRASPSWTCESWSDGYVVHAPVGRFAANGYGLHDVHGNVYEWCRELLGTYGNERVGDGLRTESKSINIRMHRGGGYLTASLTARISNRHDDDGEIRNSYIGIRPARMLPE